jgi:hypothetical protein
MGQVPVDWGVLMLNHPSYLDIGDKVKGIPKGWETCCIQMSYALNKAGAPIRNRGGVVGLQSGGQNFIIRVPTMRDYLNDEFGEAENYTGGARIAKISQIVDRTGILAFGDRHIDLWNRTDIHRPSYYIMSALWEAKSALEKGI